MVPKRRIIPVFITHSGCTHECVFCDQRRITGAVAPAGPADVRAAYMRSPPQPPAELAFYGGSFTAIPARRQEELLAAARPFIELAPANSIRISTRPDCIDEAALARLKRGGVATVELGAQSMDDEVLALSKRGHTSKDVEQASALVKAMGFTLILQMMTGLPGDTRERSLRTAERIIALKPDGVRIYPTVVVRGTELYDMWRGGRYREHTCEEAVGLCAEICALFEAAGIPVIRLGLNPSDKLTTLDAVAGAYHPAFGELVYSRIYYNKASRLLEGVPPGSDVVFAVAKGRVSMMAGQHRQNTIMLTSEFSLRSLKIIESDIKPGEIVSIQGVSGKTSF